MGPLFANNFENVGRTLLNFLAIGGGFLIGSLLGWMSVRLAGKMVFKKKPVRVIDQLAKVLGGIAGAILVAFLVFGDGGWGFGGSGGGLPGGPGGIGKQQNGNGEAIPETKTDVKIDPPKIKPKPPETDDRIKVVILGGNAQPDRFYLFEDDASASSLDELKKKIEARHQLKKLTGITVFVYKNSASLDSAVVGDVKELARKLELSIDFPPVQRELRPER